MLALSVLLHEIGHAVAARMGGYRVTSLGIGTGPPLLLLHLPGSKTLVYLCRSGMGFSGVTWVYNPQGTASRSADLLLACGGPLINALLAVVAAILLASFDGQQVQVPFLTVWVPTVVLLLVNSVLALLFFLPRQTASAEQGTLPSDGLHVLATLFPARFRRGNPSSIVAPLRTLQQRRHFWESIGDTPMLCVALIRAAETYRELGDSELAVACWEELTSLELMAADAVFQCAWGKLLAARLNKAKDPSASLGDAEKAFQTLGNAGGVSQVKRERLLRLGREAALDALQAETQTHGDAPLTFATLADRIRLLANTPTGLADLERLASQYDAARLEQESTILDVSVYGEVARVRAMNGDDGGAAIAYERALSAVRRVFVALAPFPQAQIRFAGRQTSLIAEAVECSRRLGRNADAGRYARLLT